MSERKGNKKPPLPQIIKFVIIILYSLEFKICITFYDWMFVSSYPPNSYVEALIPDVTTVEALGE